MLFRLWFRRRKKRKGRKTSGVFVKKVKKTKGFVMIINNNGIETNFDCDGTDWYVVCALKTLSNAI